jgi:hypothetical protein
MVGVEEGPADIWSDRNAGNDRATNGKRNGEIARFIVPD